MKLWKATAAMVMALGFAFSAAACGGESSISGISGLNSSSAKPESSSVSVSVGETSDKQSETSSEATSEETSSEATSSEASSESTSSEATSSESTSSEATSSESTSSESTSSESTGSGDSSEVVVNPLAEKFMGIIEKSVSEAKSFNLSYTFKSDYKDDIANPSEYDEYIAAKMNVTVSIKDTATDVHLEVIQLLENNKERKQADVYIIDNYVYVSILDYDSDTQTYNMSPYYKVKEDLKGAVEQLKGMIEGQSPIAPELLETVEELLTKIQAQDFLPAWEEVKGATLNSFTIDGNTMLLGFDAPEYITAGLDAILEYDYTQTVETVVNAALLEASGNAELTMTAVLDEMATWGAITVEDLYSNLDAWLTETYETDVQAIYDTVVFDETFEEIITMVSGDPNVAAQLQLITDLETFLFGDEGQMKDVTIDNLLVMMESMFGGSGDMEEPNGAPTQSVEPVVSEEEPAEPITVAALAEMLRSMSTMPLNELPPVQQVVGMAQMIKEKLVVNELGMELGAEFEGAGDALTLKDLYYKVGFDFEAEVTSYGENDFETVYTSKTAFFMEYALSDFSKSTVEIKMPIGVQIEEVWFCEDCGEICIVSACTREDMDDAILCGACYAIRNSQPITLGETVQKSLTANGAVAYEFEVTEEGHIQLRVVGADTDYRFGDVSIAIYDEYGDNLTNSYGGSSNPEDSTGMWYMHTEEYIKAGTYYAVVVSQTDRAMDIVVTVSFESLMFVCDDCGYTYSKEYMGSYKYDGEILCEDCYYNRINSEKEEMEKME